MSKPCDIAVYYWPAYHDEPRWRRFMPEGMGEWEVVRKAVSKFPGHYQPRVPLWGYTNEADPVIMAMKMDVALRYGVNVFAFDWYWYEDQPFLNLALDQGFLGAWRGQAIKFYLIWANHDATTLWDLPRSHLRQTIWPGAVSKDVFAHITATVIDKYFKHPAYYCITGRPLFAIYDIKTFIEGLGGVAAARAALDDFRLRAQQAGLPGIHVQAILWRQLPETPARDGGAQCTQQATIAALGIDSLTNYQWAHYVRPRGDYEAWAEQAVAAWEQWRREFAVPFFPHVSVGWDTNPRYQALQESIITGNTPELFEKYLQYAMTYLVRQQLQPPLITVNSWNEWTEGSYLEPDCRYGYQYLEAIKRARLASVQ